MNENLSKLLPKTWWIIVFVAIGGFFVGTKVGMMGYPNLAGLVIFLYSIGICWAGLVVGYQTKASEKK